VYFEVRNRSITNGPVTAFDAVAANNLPAGTTGGPTGPAISQQVIVAVPVIPFNLPVQYDPSPNEVGNASGSP
jgi:hypothetical protein